MLCVRSHIKHTGTGCQQDNSFRNRLVLVQYEFIPSIHNGFINNSMPMEAAMMKKILPSVLTAFMVVTPFTQSAHADQTFSVDRYITNENIGRLIGTGLGALIGAQIGKGNGNDAAIAAGAVGGYILGGKIGREWQPRNNGYAKPKKGYLPPVTQVPPLVSIDQQYLATKTSNVRGGPSTEYTVVNGLQPGEPVRVLGQVVNQPWYLIAQDDIVQGFVHSSLVKPANNYL